MDIVLLIVIGFFTGLMFLVLVRQVFELQTDDKKVTMVTHERKGGKH